MYYVGWVNPDGTPDAQSGMSEDQAVILVTALVFLGAELIYTATLEGN